MQIIVLPQGSRDQKVGGRRIQEKATYKASLGGLLGKVDICVGDGPSVWAKAGKTVRQRTVNVSRIVQIYAQYATCRKGKDQDIVGYLSSDKVRCDRELELHAFDVKDRQGGFCCILEVTWSNIAA